MKATISINFLSEREIETRTFTRDSKPNDEFSPIREKIKRKTITNNTLTLAIKTGKEEHHFAALISGGNFKFWDHDPSGYLMSVRFSEPDEELMKEISKVLRRVRKFYILPGNFTLSCHVSQLGPTYPEAERILKDSGNAIKSELDPIAEINIDYDLSTTDDQEIPFYSKKEFLRPKTNVKSEPPPEEPIRGPTKIERRPYDPKYLGKNDFTEPVIQDNPDAHIKRDYSEPKYPQYSKDYDKKLQKHRYQKKSFSKTIAVVIGLSILSMGSIAYAFEQGYIHLDFDAIFKGFPQLTKEPIPGEQPENKQKKTIPNGSELTLTGCTLGTDGTGKVDILCPNHEVPTLWRTPPLKAVHANDVTLTVDKGSYLIEFITPLGIKVHYFLSESKEIAAIQKPLDESKIFETISKKANEVKQSIERGISNVSESLKPKPPLTLDELRQIALDDINKYRVQNHLSLIMLGTAVSSQLYAEELLKERCIHHISVRGEGPMLRYKNNGDTMYLVAENIASAYNSGGIFPESEITRANYDMMFDDAGSNWGHRDNILTSGHRSVSIGIAYDYNNFVMVQDFEQVLKPGYQYDPSSFARTSVDSKNCW